MHIKSQYYITSHLLGRLMSERQEVTSVYEDGEKVYGEKVTFWTAGRDVNRHDQYGKTYGGSQ